MVFNFFRAGTFPLRRNPYGNATQLRDGGDSHSSCVIGKFKMAVYMPVSGFTGLFLLCLELSLIQVSMTDETCEKIDDCSCRKSSGSVISLWEIDGGSGGPPTPFKDKKGNNPDFTFSWNPCTPFSEGNDCKDVLLCQTYLNPKTLTKQTYPIGKSAKSFTVNTDSTVTISYDTIDYGGAKRTGVVILKCDPSGQDPGTLSSFDEKPPNRYTATLTSRCACDGKCPLRPSPSPGGSESSGGPSVGSILLIVFFSLVLVYFIGGILFNKYQKGIESVPEVFPNYSFWKDFPFLVKDGFVFTFIGIAGCCRSLDRKLKGDSYAKI